MSKYPYFPKKFQLCTKQPARKFCNEVSEVKWVALEEFKKMSLDEKYMVVPHAEEYGLLVAYLEKL